MMNVRLTQIDGALPNLALMKLGHWHRSQGDNVTYTRKCQRDLYEPEYDRVYGSAIFKFSEPRIAEFLRHFPTAILGGTGTASPMIVEEITGSEHNGLDYSGYPDFTHSIGFTQRGCRLSCKFCVVPKKEGRNRGTNTIADIWRGQGHPKKLHLLDNDFFGQQDWPARIAEIREGKFKVCLSQGINVRLLDQEAAESLATIEYRNTKFNERKLYTAWDNLKDEDVFFRGVDTLERAGIPSKHLMAYMLVGFDKRETWDRIWHRFNRMVAREIEPFVMVFDRARKDLTRWARWVNMGMYRFLPYADYDPSIRAKKSEIICSTAELFEDNHTLLTAEM